MSRARFLAAILMLLAAPLALAEDVLIELDRFGVGSTFRPGEWVAARFRATLRSGEAQSVQLVWEVENSDGDIAEHVRPMVLNPGAPTVRWLSAWLPPNVVASSVFSVRIYADEEGSRGRELASTRVSPATANAPGAFVPLSESILGVLGSGSMNLQGFSTSFGTLAAPRGSHEATRVVSGLDARELPDRWEGLMGFEALIWTDVPPTTLELEEAEALREHLRRGGHLVIVLPQAGNPWSLGTAAANQLSDLLPTVAPRREEGVTIDSLTPLLSKNDGVRNPRAITGVHLWDPAKLDRGWEPLLAMPAARSPESGLPTPTEGTLEGQCVAIQRRLGFGRLTLVGIDVAAISPLALQPGGMPQPDAFWNRIIGRRSDTPTPEELRVLDETQPKRLGPERTDTFNMGGGDLIASRIGMSGPAVTGTLLALVVFAAYWLVAGPIGFLLLKKFGKVRHAWLAFVLTGIVFTAVSWAGGAAIRLGAVRIQHVSIVDHVARVAGTTASDEPQHQRAVSWMSVYLPGYGTTEVRIASEPGQRDLLASWLPPGSNPQRFPNVDRYEVPYSSPGAYRIPSRATATTLHANWLGAVSEDLGRMPYASDPAKPIREVITRAPQLTASLEGTLRHGLRGTLTNVRIIHISSLRTPRRVMSGVSGTAAAEPAFPGELPAFGRMSSVSSWTAGDEIDLALLYRDDRAGVARPIEWPESRTLPRGLSATLRARYHDDLVGELGGFASGMPSLTPAMWTRSIEMLSIFNMLPPPRWLSEGLTEKNWVRYLRQLGHELDLSVWFTRPCLIVIGQLWEDEPDAGTPCPIPLFVGDERPAASGVTIVRWILPLPLAPDLIVDQPRSTAGGRDATGARPRSTDPKGPPTELDDGPASAPAPGDERGGPTSGPGAAPSPPTSSPPTSSPPPGSTPGSTPGPRRR